MKYLLSFLLLIGTLSYGQMPATDLGSITGTVMDQSLQQPIPYATVSVETTAGELITGTISNDEGLFQLDKIPYGNYTLKIQFMGYKSLTKEISFSSSHKTITLGTIYLQANVSELEDVVVVAERTTIEQLIDRKVVHVGKDLSTSGASASEIMNKIPSVRVDIDGNIYLRGDGNVRVLVDGKPTNIEPATLLKQIPSSSIEKIELITNPSAKYNPEGMSGIINIVLKKNSKLGFNGNFNAGVTVAKHLQSNAALNLNYRSGKFNFYSNLGYNYGENEMVGYIREINGPGENIDFQFTDQGGLVKLGMDYYMDDYNIFSFYTNQNIFNEGFQGLVGVFFPANPNQDFIQDFNMEQEGLSSTYNFNYKHKFKKEGHEIEFETDYNSYDSDRDSDFDYLGELAPQPYNEGENTERTNFIANVDYVNPITETAKLELGAEARLRNTENDYNSTRQTLPDVYYTYQEDIYSFYSTFGQDFDKWAYQIGVRLENFSTSAKQDGTNILDNDYFTAYPSAFVTYTPSKENSYQMSYSRRINRPSLWQLNPTRRWSTPRITSIGNPALKPEFINSLELNYSHDFEEASIHAGVFYKMITDNITQIFIEDPENPQKLLLTHNNADNNATYGVELSGRVRPLDFWEARASFNLYRITANGVIGTTQIEEENTSYRVTTNHNFEVTEQLKLQLFGMYAAPIQTLQFRIEDRYFLNLGARYSFLDDKASLSVNFNDVFNTRVQELSTTRPIPQIGRLKRDTQSIQVGFSYRFGSGKNRTRQRKELDKDSGGGGMF